MPDLRHVVIVAGDPSGDLHASRLAQALKLRVPGLRITSLGGIHLKAISTTFISSLVSLGGFGFWEPLLKILPLRRALASIKGVMENDRPDLIIPVDYYGFNIHVARQAAQRQIPVIYYISPQVWASRPHRIRELAKVLRRMLVIFPFEVPLYEAAGVPVSFVGHPLLETIPEPAPSLPPRTKIGLLPGSRWGTVRRHLPIVIEAAQKLRHQFPDAEIVLFRPPELAPERYAPFLSETPWLRLVSDPEYRERRDLSLAISVSGTAALENMMLGIPMLIMYRLSWLTYWIAKTMIRIPFVGIPNILAGKLVVPELLQQDCNPKKLAQTAGDLLRNREVILRMRETLINLRSSLLQGGTTKAAEEIMEAMA